MRPGALPADSHVHSEWSWDAPDGSMDRTCARAVELGLPAVAFTEHFDLTRWLIRPEVRAGMTQVAHLVGDDDRFDPPPLDVDGYFTELAACRERYPDLRISSGVELGEPHWFPDQVDELLAGGGFDRVLGSLHSIEVGSERWIVDRLDGAAAPADLDPHAAVRAYLAEALTMVSSCASFAVLAHLDYPVRGWPAALGDFPLADFEEEVRAVLTALAGSGRALEINTRIPFDPLLVRWWRDAGGRAVTFGSDAHSPEALANGFRDAAAVAEAAGFRFGTDPFEPWST